MRFVGVCRTFRQRARAAIWIAALAFAPPAFCLPATATPAVAPGAPPARFLHFKSENFLHFTSENGLSQNTVRAILQDRSGFLWFATEEGLNRFDGYSFVVFRNQRGQKDSLPQDMVTALCEDRLGQLWVGTLDGVSLYDARTETFSTRLPLQHQVRALVEDRTGALWVATEGDGVYRLDRGSAEPVHYRATGEANALSSNNVFALLEDPAGRIWIGTHGKGLDLLDRATGRFTHYRHAAANPRSLSHDEIWSMAQDDGGRIWVGTNGGGLSVLDPSTGTFMNYMTPPAGKKKLQADVITAVYRDRSGTMWVGSLRDGLNRYVSEEDAFVAYEHNDDHPESLGRNAIRAIFEDVQGNLWVSTYSDGLNLLRRNNHPFTYYNHNGQEPDGLIDSGIGSLLEDRDGNVWVGTAEGGLHRFVADKGKFVHYKLDRTPILALYQDRRGRMWLGTYGQGLYRFDLATGTFTSYRSRTDDPTTQRDDQIWQIYEDDQGVLWLATDQGIICINPDGGVVRRYRHDELAADSLSDDQVRKFLPDGEGGLWVATLGGLDHLQAGRPGFVHYRHEPRDPSSLAHDWVISLHHDSQGRFWVGTFGGGLDLFDPKTGRFTAYRETDGLPSNVIYGILEDEVGRLWLSTNKGLCRFNPADGHVETFDLTNGLQSLQFNIGVALKTRSQSMFFGGNSGLYQFDPRRITPNSFAPPVVFTALRVFGEPRKTRVALPLADEIRLSHRDDIFSIEFAALDYTFPRRNKYEYKLEGFNDRWISLGLKRDVTFTNLDPGHYVFRVRGSNSDGVWEEAGRSLHIVIPPPFWATWWWRIACLLAFSGLLLSAHRWRVRRLEARERELEERVEDAMSRVKVLKGLLPICATCKKVRDDRGYWNQIESYIRDRSEADFSHGICPDCIARYYPEYQGTAAKKQG